MHILFLSLLGDGKNYNRMFPCLYNNPDTLFSECKDTNIALCFCLLFYEVLSNVLCM